MGHNKATHECGDICRIKPVSDKVPTICVGNMKNGCLCRVVSVNRHSVYVRVKREKVCYPVHPDYLVLVKREKKPCIHG